jgi:hypothetical protein
MTTPTAAGRSKAGTVRRRSTVRPVHASAQSLADDALDAGTATPDRVLLFAILVELRGIRAALEVQSG